jgi:4-aminobutyrate aminotransferase
VTGPDLKTALPGPKARALIERDARVVSTSYTRDYPLVVARGEGVFVEDVDGNVFLDCTAGIAVASTGHSHPEVVAAIADQAGRFLHMSGTDFYYEPQVRLAEELSAIAPMEGPHRSFFGNSGTEANEAALKLAKYHTQRHNIIAFLGAFHGRTMGSLSLTARTTRLTPTATAVRSVRSPNRAPPSVCASSRSRSSCTWCRRTRSRRLSWSPSKVRAAMSCLRTSSTSGCAS